MELQSIGTLKSDPEKQDQTEDAAVKSGTLDLNHYRIVNEVWHFMSVDWGYRCKSVPRTVNLADPMEILVSATTLCTM